MLRFFCIHQIPHYHFACIGFRLHTLHVSSEHRPIDTAVFPVQGITFQLFLLEAGNGERRKHVISNGFFFLPNSWKKNTIWILPASRTKGVTRWMWSKMWNLHQRKRMIQGTEARTRRTCFRWDMHETRSGITKVAETGCSSGPGISEEHRSCSFCLNHVARRVAQTK